MTMASEMYMDITGDGTVLFSNTPFTEQVGVVKLEDLIDLILGWSRRDELRIFDPDDTGHGWSIGSIVMQDRGTIAITFDDLPYPFHVHPRRLLLQMCDRIKDLPNITLRLTNMDEDLEIHRVEKERPMIKCDRCGIPIPDVPEDASYEELICDTCRNEICAARHSVGDAE
jgi:hypothetical protein